MADGSADSDELGFGELGETDGTPEYGGEEPADEYGGANPSDLWGDGYDDVRQSTGAVDELEKLEEEFDSLAEEFEKETQESQALLETLRNLEDGDYNDAAKGATGKAREFASKIPLVGDKVARVGRKRSVVRQLKTRYQVIQDQHEALSDHKDNLGVYIDEQQDRRSDAYDKYKEAKTERLETEEQLEEALNEYQEVLGELVAADELEPQRAVQLGLDEEEAREYGREERDLEPERVMELEEQRMDIEDERITPLRDQLGELSEQEKRYKGQWRLSDMYLENAKVVKEAADKWYEIMTDYEQNIQQAVEGEVQIGKVMEQANDIAMVTESTKNMLRKTAKLRADQVVQLEGATNEIWGENVIDEETSEYVRERLEEVEKVREETAQRAHREVTQDES